MQLENISPIAFIQEHQIKTETGLLFDLRSHKYLYRPLADLSPRQCSMKAAQIGMTTLEILKAMWVVKNLRLDAIYTLPTAEDMNLIVGSKVNRIIAQNPILQEWTKDKDTIEQKQIGNNFLYFRGTWTQKAATMIPSDLNIHDELDASNQSVIEQYSTRLQHSKHQWEWFFSHPSAESTGVHNKWLISDQKHWFVKCSHCNFRQYLEFPKSLDETKKIFVCKRCDKEIYDEDRRTGEWVARYPSREFKGYWIPLLIAPHVSAKRILQYRQEKTEEYFYNKVLGLPYVGGGNKLTKANFMQNLRDEIHMQDGQIVIGVDTGLNIHLTVGDKNGLFYFSETSDYEELRYLLGKRFKKAVCIIDAGGDLIGSRKIKEEFAGRVYLCSFGSDKTGEELAKWNEDDFTVLADRNRCVQLTVDEFTDRRIPVIGTETDWYPYWVHWNALTRVSEVNKHGQVRKIWARNGPDHWAMATVYWRIGMMKFGGEVGKILQRTGKETFTNTNEQSIKKVLDLVKKLT